MPSLTENLEINRKRIHFYDDQTGNEIEESETFKFPKKSQEKDGPSKTTKRNPPR